MVLPIGFSRRCSPRRELINTTSNYDQYASGVTIGRPVATKVDTIAQHQKPTSTPAHVAGQCATIATNINCIVCRVLYIRQGMLLVCWAPARPVQLATATPAPASRATSPSSLPLQACHTAAHTCNICTATQPCLHPAPWPPRHTHAACAL